MLIEIYLLEQLRSLAKNGTLSAASTELHLTQPTLTRSMQKLEQQIGVPLFDRENKKIRLNENGLLAADYAEKILSLEEEMTRRIHLQERSRHTITFGSVSPGPIKELVPMFSDLVSGMAIHAEMQDEMILMTGIREGAYRFIALHHPVDEPGLFCCRTVSERIYYSFLPVEHPVSTDGVYFRDINGRDILMPSNVGFWKDIIAREMPDSFVIVQEGNELVNIVAEHSDLPAFSSDIAIRHNLIRPARVSVPILDDAAKVDYFCICKSSDREMIRTLRMFDPTA